MQSNTSEQQYFGGDLQLTAPHFDEEATVLSARPVVPLQNIRENSVRPHSKRQLVFGLAILASLMLGALGATLIYQQRGQETAAVIVDAAVPGSGASPLASAVTASATGEVKGSVAEREVGNANTAAEDKKPEPHVVQALAQPVVVTRKAPSVKAPKYQAEPLDEVDERETRHAERIEARRLRWAEREQQNGPRGRRGRAADDLLRIREIFEGPGRP